jgi:hypothetical protein
MECDGKNGSQYSGRKKKAILSAKKNSRPADEPLFRLAGALGMAGGRFLEDRST